VSSTVPDQRRLLEVIAFQAEVLGAAADPDATMQLACDRARVVTGAGGAAIELAHGDDLVCHVSSGSLASHAGRRLALATGMSGLAVRTGGVQRCDDSERDARVDRAACRRAGLRSMLCVPLRHAGITVGVLEVISPRTAAFDDVDVALLTLLSGVIAGAMTQAELIRRLQEPRHRLTA